MNNMFKNQGSIVIVQITRLGDVIQTYLATQGLKKINPKLKLTLIMREQFYKQLGFLLDSVFDDIILIPSLSLASLSKEDLTQTVHELIDAKIQQPVDVTVNLSFCNLSQIICGKINSIHNIGPFRNENNQVCINDSWGQFVYTNVLENKLCPFNLVDVYKSMLGSQCEKEVNFVHHHKTKKDKLVIHPFASEQKKKWGLSKWGETIHDLLKNNPGLTITIVGDSTETQEAERLLNAPILQNFLPQINNRVGNFTIEETLEELKSSKLFIGNDSMVSHLAAIAKTPTITISLGPVKPRETAPYQLNHLTIAPKISCYPCSVDTKCDLLPCHGKIHHQLVTHLANHMYKNSSIDGVSLANLSPHTYESVNIYSNIAENNKIILRKVDSHSYSTEEFFTELYEVLWSFFLDDHEVNLQFPKLSKGTIASLEETLTGIEKLHQLYQHALSYSAQLAKNLEKRNASKEIINELTNRLMEVDRLSLILSETYTNIAPLIKFFYVQKSNNQSVSLIDVANANFLNYHQSSQAVEILVELITKTINSHQTSPQKSNESTTS
jgi:ADP-heptose:LPS heptosyltransferase